MSKNIKEITTKDEFTTILSVAMLDLEEYVEILNTFDEKMQQPKIMLNLMMKTANYDEASRSVVNQCFDEFNALKKCIAKIETKRDKIKAQITFAYFKKFYLDSHDFNVKVIELNDLINKYKEKVNEQIIKCIDYFNDHDVKITL